MEYNEILDELMSGTGFEISNTSDTLTSNPLKVKTPIEVFNCMLGGGIPLSTIVHTFGLPKGGKSTWLYQMMGLFQKQYPDGVCAILDMESSADPIRLQALGVDTSKVIVLPATSIESGFISLLSMIKNKQNNSKIKDIPMFVIWDTISRGMAQDNSTQSRMNAQDRARIIKNYLGQLTAEINRQPFILCLINQAITKINSYGGASTAAPGGVALQHEVHFSVKIDYKSESLDDSKSFVMKKWSNITIDKSKISPEIRSIPFTIDITKGGVIDEIESFVWFIVESMGFISYTKGWYNLDPLIDIIDNELIKNYVSSYNKKFRYDGLLELFKSNEIMYNILKYVLCSKLSEMFGLQSVIISPYKDEIFSKINESLLSLNKDEEERNKDGEQITE